MAAAAAQTHAAKKPNLIAHNVGVLPPDVLFEVLLRLPADEICRLRLVCRPWRRLTCDPVFAKAHSSHHAHVVALERSLGEIHVIDLSSGDVVKQICVGDDDKDIVTVGMSSQHDLVAVSYEAEDLDPNTTWSSRLDIIRRAAAATKKSPRVFNLVTGAAAAANALPSEQPAGAPLSLSTPTYLLGHVASAGEYKVLRLGRQVSISAGGGGFDVGLSSHVATLAAAAGDIGATAARQWRATARPPLSVPFLSHFVMGGTTMAYHCAGGIAVVACRSTAALALFDFATEQWRPTPLRGPPVADPSAAPGATSSFRLSSLGGSLVVTTVHSAGDEESSADLWFFEDDVYVPGGGDMDHPRSTKRYTMRLSPPHLEGYYGRLVEPLLVLGDGRIVAWVSGWGEGLGILGAYDPDTRTWAAMATVSKAYSCVAVCQGTLLCPRIVL